MQPNSSRIPGWLVVLALLSAACGGPEPPPSRDPGVPREPISTPQLIYENITLTQAKPDGGILWRLRARLAEYESPPENGSTPVQLGSAHLQSIEGEFFDADNRAIRTRAERGSVYPDERRLELTGQVAVESERDNLHLQAERLQWLPEQRLLEAEGQVQVELLDGQGSLWGDRLRIDFGQAQMQLENWDPSQPVRAKYRDPELELTASRLLWNFGAGEVQALGAVEVDAPQQRVRLSGEQLRAPLPLTELRLLGNVKAKAVPVGGTGSLQTGQELEAQEIRWRIGSTQLQALGNVRYRQPGQALTVSGDQGILDWQANTARIQGNSQTRLTLP
ncbi:LPS export ABC transporter periplasmic protein LptC [Synechococcus sp. H55.10]|uniref:LPS export ABC transporter periplasmic protein LptC n=1 Tax=Synechococcus sp. H55.10 TaxID=2964503 RepID=UPI0039C66517